MYLDYEFKRFLLVLTAMVIGGLFAFRKNRRRKAILVDVKYLKENFELKIKTDFFLFSKTVVVNIYKNQYTYYNDAGDIVILLDDFTRVIVNNKNTELTKKVKETFYIVV